MTGEHGLLVAPRLVDTVRAPLFYLGVEPSKEPAASAQEGVLSIQELLADASLPLLLDWRPDGSAAAAVSLLRRFLDGSESDLELALTNIVPTGIGAAATGQPLLIFRGRLGAEEAEAVRRLLADPGRATPSRVIQGHAVSALTLTGAAAGRGSAGAPRSVGSLIEVAVVGRDLLVSNHGAALKAVLMAAEPAPGAERAPRETSARDTLPLAADPRFQRLRGNVEVRPGGILLFADGPRLSRRLLGGLTQARTMPMLEWSGLVRARAMLSALQPRDGSGGFIATVMVDLGDTRIPDGWLSTLDPRSARDLAAVLPAAGVGGVSVGFAPDALIKERSASPAGDLLEQMRTACTRGCAMAGVDFEVQILRRLTGHASLHVLAGIGDGIGHVWTFRAKSPASARSIFRDLGIKAREVDPQEGAPWVQRIPAVDGAPEMLRIRTLGNRVLWLTTLKGEVVVGGDQDSVAGYFRLQAESRRRDIARRRDAVLDGMQLLGRTTRSEAGLLGAFDIDLMPTLERYMVDRHGEEGVQALQGSVLPLRWIGFLDRTDGLLRVQVLGRR